jgi:NAD(P)-dependent dehydrogenase (short-subunit alcohol dehydrogenase family)
MEIKDKIAVVTGGASGIGEALCRRFMADGAKGVVVVDMDTAGTKRVASEIGGIAMAADVSKEEDIQRIVRDTEEQLGPIDLFCSNAGIICIDPTHIASSSNEEWERMWGVNVMAHVYAARAVLPSMIKRGDGYILSTASAAGLLSQIGSAPYSVTKHAAIGFAESVAIAHGGDGIKVSVICPQAVRTGMTRNTDGGGVAGGDGMLEPEQLVETTMQGIRDEQFMILPHAEVQTYIQRKAADYDRWIGGMQRWRSKFQ